MFKRIVSLGLVGVMLLSAVMLAVTPQTFANEGEDETNTSTGKVTICHRTNSVTNPYNLLEVNVNAVDGIAGNNGKRADHYGQHQGPLAMSEAYARELKKDKIDWGDIIPPVAGHDGLNWTDRGQKMLANGCNYVVPTVVSACVANPALLVTNQNEQGFNYSRLGTPYADTGVDGRYEYVDGALRLTTLNPADSSSTNKVQGARTVNIPLSQYGGDFAVNFVASYGTIEPGINIRVDADNDGDVDVTLVAEPNVAGYETFWTRTPGYLPASTGGQGGPYAGDQQDFLNVWPNAVVRVEAFSLGSGVGTDGDLISWSTPCNTYTYDFVEGNQEPDTAVLSVNIQVLPRNCEVAAQLIYNFTVEGASLVGSSTAYGTFGPRSYSISFAANEGFVFAPQTGGVLNDDATVITFSGELAGSLDPTSPECVLGEETPEEPVIPGTPVTPETPDVLPNTSASSPATIISILAGLTAAIALAGATLRTTLYKGL